MGRVLHFSTRKLKDGRVLIECEETEEAVVGVNVTLGRFIFRQHKR